MKSGKIHWSPTGKCGGETRPQHQVVLEAEKCQGILEYCSQKVKDFIKSFIRYQAGDWQQLQAKILKYYDVEREEWHY